MDPAPPRRGPSSVPASILQVEIVDEILDLATEGDYSLARNSLFLTAALIDKSWCAVALTRLATAPVLVPSNLAAYLEGVDSESVGRPHDQICAGHLARSVVYHAGIQRDLPSYEAMDSQWRREGCQELPDMGLQDSDAVRVKWEAERRAKEEMELLRPVVQACSKISSLRLVLYYGPTFNRLSYDFLRWFPEIQSFTLDSPPARLPRAVFSHPPATLLHLRHFHMISGFRTLDDFPQAVVSSFVTLTAIFFTEWWAFARVIIRVFEAARTKGVTDVLILGPIERSAASGHF